MKLSIKIKGGNRMIGATNFMEVKIIVCFICAIVLSMVVVFFIRKRKKTFCVSNMVSKEKFGKALKCEKAKHCTEKDEIQNCKDTHCVVCYGCKVCKKRFICEIAVTCKKCHEKCFVYNGYK